MAVLTPREALEVCYEAGFRWNKGIVLMPSIGWAESRLRTDARGVNYKKNPDGSFVLVNGQKVVDSTDRGWLQINDKWHPDMTDEMCDDPLEAAKYAFKISSGGTKFSLWSTFNNGSYRGPEGLTYALFMAEWSAKAERLRTLGLVSTITALEAEAVTLSEEKASLAQMLSDTTASLNATTADLNAKAEELRVTKVSLAETVRELGDALAAKQEIERISLERQTKIDNARAALA